MMMMSTNNINVQLYFFAFLIVLFCCATEWVESSDPSNDHNNKDFSPLWFGPRIGRKKRNPSMESKFYKAENEHHSSIDLLDALRDAPLVVVAINEARKQHNFIPRLGRESGENRPLTNNNNWPDDEEQISDSDIFKTNINPFAPRLGRNNADRYIPRLGRENDM